jgi:hypothetical protein
MPKKEDKESQKSALGKGLAEVLARQAESEGEETGGEKDVKTQAQEFLLSVEDRIKTISGSDVDITDVEIEYLQARTAFAVGNFQGTLDYLGKINQELEDLEKQAEKEKKENPSPPEDEVPAESEDLKSPEEKEEVEWEEEEDEEEEEEAEGDEEEEILPEDMPMVYCMMCGEQITEGSLFCNWCGEKVT